MTGTTWPFQVGNSTRSLIDAKPAEVSYSCKSGHTRNPYGVGPDVRTSAALGFQLWPGIKAAAIIYLTIDNGSDPSPSTFSFVIIATL